MKCFIFFCTASTHDFKRLGHLYFSIIDCTASTYLAQILLNCIVLFSNTQCRKSPHLAFSRWEKLSGVIAFLSPEDGACPNTCHETQLHRRKKRKKKESSPYSVRSSQEMCKRQNWICEDEASLCCGHGRERDLESTGKVPHYSKC